MKKLFPIFCCLLVLSSCTSSTEAERPTEWMGEWKAEWETPPESYPGIEDMEFYMNGQFTFTDDSLTVTANGYPGCIFNIDTLSHRQSWKISGDTLFLLNDPELPGMTYQIKSFSENRIQLQLMEDIFVTLSK
ncbi:MAG: hypothetical protein AAF391_05255 [Bacteroidota bacterium]